MFTSHSINPGQVHLLEWWQSGNFSYSKLDDGLINSASGGRIDNTGQSQEIRLAGVLGQFFSGSILDIYFSSASNRVGAADDAQVTAVRNYYSDRYNIPV